MKKILLALSLSALCAAAHAYSKTETPASLSPLNTYVALEGEKSRQNFFVHTCAALAEKEGPAALLKPESLSSSELNKSVWHSLKGEELEEALRVYHDVLSFSVQIARFAVDETQGDSLVLTPSNSAYPAVTLSRSDAADALSNNTELLEYTQRNLGEEGLAALLTSNDGLGLLKEYITWIQQLPETVLARDVCARQSYIALAWITTLPQSLREDHSGWAISILDHIVSLMLNSDDTLFLVHNLGAYESLFRFYIRFIEQEITDRQCLNATSRLLEKVVGPLFALLREKGVATPEEAQTDIENTLRTLSIKKDSTVAFKKNVYKLNCLGRNSMPTYLASKGIMTTSHTATPEEFRTLIKDKLIEESGELVAAHSREEVLGELADVYEVLTAFCEAYEITPGEVAAYRQEKRASRGDFSERLVLDTAEVEEGSADDLHLMARGRERQG